jgi:type II secretory pathway pseudopilin PulG
VTSRRDKLGGSLAASNRPGMTVAECTVALAILLVVGVIVAQSTVWILREQARRGAHQAALEVAANVLETARATPPEQLSRAWAEAQTIPADSADLLPGGAVVVTVEPEKSFPQTRRVTVEVRWRPDANLPPQSVQLTTLLSERSATKAGGEP